MKKILIATDFSAHADRATQHGVALARRLGAEVELLSISLVAAALPGPTGMAPGDDERVRKLEARLEAATATLRSEGLTVQGRVTTGTPSTEIQAAARACQADLIVMGTRGLTGLPHILLGSVAERVARTATCPVFTAHADHPEPGEYRELLVATDFSPASDAALTWARGLAERLGARITLMHCLLLPVWTGELEVPRDAAWVESRRSEAQARLAEIAAPGEQHEIVSGAPYEAGLRLAEQRGVDLVVFGTRGLTGLEHVLLGSNAERALRLSHVPVVVTHPTPKTS